MIPKHSAKCVLLSSGALGGINYKVHGFRGSLESGFLTFYLTKSWKRDYSGSDGYLHIIFQSWESRGIAEDTVAQKHMLMKTDQWGPGARRATNLGRDANRQWEGRWWFLGGSLIQQLEAWVIVALSCSQGVKEPPHGITRSSTKATFLYERGWHSTHI